MRTTPGHGPRRAVAVVLLATAASGLFAVPAYADDPADLRVQVKTQDVRLQVGGGQQVVTAVVTNNGPAGVSAPVLQIQVPLTSRGVTVAGSQPVECQATGGPGVLTCQLPAMNPGQQIEFTMGLNPPAEGLGDNETVREEGQFTIQNVNGGDPSQDNNTRSFKATMSTQNKGVTEVAGVVVSASENAPLAGVRVVVKDSAGSQGEALTDGLGKFSLRPNTPMKSGSITVDATKDGFSAGHTIIDGSSGGVVGGIQFAMSPVAPSAPPSPSESPSPSPSPAAAPVVAAQTKATDSGSSSKVALILVLSGLSAAILIGAGLWVALRRNRDSDPALAGAGMPNDATVRIGDEALLQAFPQGPPGPRVDSATQVIGGAPTQVYQPGGYQPAAGGYQPAAGGYQPASGGYQPASGAGYGAPAYPPPPPTAGPAYPPPPDRTTVYGQDQGGYPPAPPADALYGQIPSAMGRETTALTPPSGPAGEPRPPAPASPAAPFGAPAAPFGAPARPAEYGPPTAQWPAPERGGAWQDDPLTAPMPAEDENPRTAWLPAADDQRRDPRH
ncbi:MAG: hypothetical protein QOD41_2617 [Cryptosporangiaceae bacterium]|nr:hypothetical protein [Cryptosporangiaceae bacterium]